MRRVGNKASLLCVYVIGERNEHTSFTQRRSSAELAGRGTVAHRFRHWRHYDSRLVRVTDYLLAVGCSHSFICADRDGHTYHVLADEAVGIYDAFLETTDYGL